MFLMKPATSNLLTLQVLSSWAEAVLGSLYVRTFGTSPMYLDCNATHRILYNIYPDKSLDLLVNLSASPWHVGKEFDRIELLRKAASACNCTVAYCNAVGGNDELIFDGNSVVLNSEGVILFKCTGFAEDIKLATSKSDFSNKLQEDNLEKYPPRSSSWSA